MGQRLQLHEILKEIPGVSEAYFQPPPSVKMVYPCIVYQRDYAQSVHADNSLYKYTKRYQVTVIDRNPDSLIPDKVAALPLCAFVRFYTADDLNHDVYDLYY